MKRSIGLLLFCLLLFGCNSKPVPDWTDASFSHLERFKELYVKGEDQIAEAHFRKAIEEIKKSGDLSVLQRAYLTKYAVQVSILEPFGGDEYRQIEAVQPVAENGNFFAFLAGVPPAQVSEELLPVQYRKVFAVFKRGGDEELQGAVAKIRDPLSRLIAVGWLVKQERSGEGLLLIAADTASREGWKKALLVYLDRLHAYYLAKKEMTRADAVRQRIRLIGN